MTGAQCQRPQVAVLFVALTPSRSYVRIFLVCATRYPFYGCGCGVELALGGSTDFRLITRQSLQERDDLLDLFIIELSPELAGRHDGNRLLHKQSSTYPNNPLGLENRISMARAPTTFTTGDPALGSSLPRRSHGSAQLYGRRRRAIGLELLPRIRSNMNAANFHKK